MWDLIVSVPDHCLSFYFLVPKYESGWDRFENYEISSLYHCRHGPVRFMTLKLFKIFS